MNTVDISTFISPLIQTERLSTRPGLYIEGDILRPGLVFNKFVNKEKNGNKYNSKHTMN
jgi:hypothetical protein